MAKQANDYFTRKMFVRQFTPSLISALGLAVGDMADAIVVGRRMGVTGLAAISLSLPVFMVINVLMHGFGIGGSIRFSSQSAQGNRQEAVRGFQGVMGAAILVSVVLALAGNLFLPQLLGVLGTTSGDGALFQASRTYVQIIVLGMPLFFASYILNYYLRNDDCQKLASLGFTVGNLSDILLNIVLVLVLDLGVAGAAWATLAGQVISIVFYLTSFRGKRHVLRIFPIKPDFRGAWSCFRVGFSSSVQYLFSMVFILSANHVLLRLSSSVGVAVFDMVQNASYLILYLYDGTAKAAQPLISTYWGEHNEAGRKRTLEIGLCWGSAAGAAAILLVALFPGLICLLFGLTDPAAVKMGSYALRIFCISGLFAGVSILAESYFQSCGDEKNAFILTTLRGAAILLPMTLLFSFFGEYAFWWLFPATELFSLVLFLLWYKHSGKGQPSFQSERVYTRIIRSRNRELAPLTAEIEEFCEKWDAAPKQSYFVTMTVEELCSAIMVNGFKGGEGYIQVTLIAGEDGVFSLHVRDSAVSFDPFSLHTKKADSGEDFDMDAMGILVIRNTAKEFFYRRYQGFNTLIVKI